MSELETKPYSSETDANSATRSSRLAILERFLGVRGTSVRVRANRRFNATARPAPQPVATQQAETRMLITGARNYDSCTRFG